MVLTAASLLAHDPHPGDREIDAAFAGVMCRCGTYQRVRRAVHRAADGDWENAPFAAAALPPAPAPPNGPVFPFNPWVGIARDGTVVVTIGRSEMGQGIMTTLASLVAEELDVALPAVRTVAAPVDRAYDDPTIGLQITVGSLSVKNLWLPVRRAAADVRERLLAAAAARWGVDPAACRIEDGGIVHVATRRWLDFGEVAEAAAALAPHAEPRLKESAAFRILGKPTARLEVPDHVAGRTVFGLDVVVPEMLVATLVMPPVIGAKPVAIDATVTRAIAGVRHVVEVSAGVAVVADDAWSAILGRSTLDVAWGPGTAADLSSSSIERRLLGALDREGRVERAHGDVDRALGAAAFVHEATYVTPYLAHAPIEPPNATARVAGGRGELWVPTQGQTTARAAAAEAGDLPIDAVTLHTTFLGGGFGRRAVPDVGAQAVEIARVVGRPVQLVWMRDDDLRHDRYRPAGAVRVRAGIEPDGRIAAWRQHVAGPKLALEGIDVPYAIDALRIEVIEDDPGVPTGYWRSVGASQNAFAIESFVDELAAVIGKDPVEFRLHALAAAPRYRTVLEVAADRAGWGKRAPACDGRGVAVTYAHGGWAAQVAEVSMPATERSPCTASSVPSTAASP